jgi:hypothetical protein
VVRFRTIAAYRLLFASLAAAALGYEANPAASGPHGLVNFVSYFTNECNILAIVVIGGGGIAAVAGRRAVPDQLRGALVVYLVVTGTVYATLLAGLPNQHVTPWTNTVMHQIMPAVVVIDWLIDPPRVAMSVRRALWWLVFPITYLGYTLARGAVVDWYPYPFLTPTHQGYLGVAENCAGIAGGFLLLIGAVTLLGNALGRRLASRDALDLIRCEQTGGGYGQY